jgi:cell division protein ZapE
VTPASDLNALYGCELQRRGWSGDDAQRGAVARLEQLRAELLARRARLGLWARLRRRWWPQPGDAPRGVYLWGSVGRGKTWLMDLFFDALGPVARRRRHFHHLMRAVHASLATIQRRQDPLRVVARRMARQASLWCIDELQVSDIADAMLLGGLLDELLRRGITLVVTSNLPPAELYRDGLQRARFLPAIALLEQRLDLLQVDGGTDYRLRQMRQLPIYVQGDEAAAAGRLEALYAQLADPHAESNRHVEINGRRLSAQRRSGGVIWFSFAALCDEARSADDYAELAQDFHTVFLGGIPLLDAARDDAARRFISLVDEFYDRGVKLVVSAAASPPELYRGERLAFEFRRTASRLTEMQGEQYLARPHLKSMD